MTAPLTPVTLLALAPDDPLAYCFEVDRWPSVMGAARQLSHLHARLTEVISGDTLHADSLYFLATMPDQPQADRAIHEAMHAAASLTGIMTLSGIAESFPARALTEGVHPAPSRVVGVPGVTPYQARINRYYGLNSSSTIPSPEQIAARRHFGQVVERLRGRLQAARFTRQVFPFYELLPFAERCALCKIRPAEGVIVEVPLCGVCERRELDGNPDPARYQAVIAFQLQGLERRLSEQRTPNEYRALYTAVQGAIQAAVNDSGASVIRVCGDHGLLAVSGRGLLRALRTLASTFAARSHAIKPALPLYIGAGIGSASPASLWKIAQNALAAAQRSADPDRLALQFLTLPDPTLYTVDALTLLDSAVERLYAARFPADPLADMGVQIGRGTASLYYSYGRMRLESGQLRLLDKLEDEWGKESARFYRALHDALTLARLPTDG